MYLGQTDLIVLDTSSTDIIIQQGEAKDIACKPTHPNVTLSLFRIQNSDAPRSNSSLANNATEVDNFLNSNVNTNLVENIAIMPD